MHPLQMGTYRKLMLRRCRLSLHVTANVQKPVQGRLMRNLKGQGSQHVQWQGVERCVAYKTVTACLSVLCYALLYQLYQPRCENITHSSQLLPQHMQDLTDQMDYCNEQAPKSKSLVKM